MCLLSINLCLRERDPYNSSTHYILPTTGYSVKTLGCFYFCPTWICAGEKWHVPCSWLEFSIVKEVVCPHGEQKKQKTKKDCGSLCISMFWMHEILSYWDYNSMEMSLPILLAIGHQNTYGIILNSGHQSSTGELFISGEEKTEVVGQFETMSYEKRLKKMRNKLMAKCVLGMHWNLGLLYNSPPSPNSKKKTVGISLENP